MTPAANPDISVGNVSNLAKQLVLVDSELMEVQGVTGTTYATVIRGFSGTLATSHASGARVYTGQPSYFVYGDKLGSCTEATERVLPVFSINRASKQVRMYNCVGGVWRSQTPPVETYQGSLEKVCTVPIGSVAYGSFGTSTTTSTTKQLMAEVFVPQTMYVTGITELNGSAVDTNSKVIVALYSISGNKVANSAVAGTANTGNDAFLAVAFTTPALVTGPAKYLVALQDDTADTNGVRTVATATFNNLVAGEVTSVFGTLAAVTVPTTFTADKGPIACLY